MGAAHPPLTAQPLLKRHFDMWCVQVVTGEGGARRSGAGRERAVNDALVAHHTHADTDEPTAVPGTVRDPLPATDRDGCQTSKQGLQRPPVRREVACSKHALSVCARCLTPPDVVFRLCGSARTWSTQQRLVPQVPRQLPLAALTPPALRSCIAWHPAQLLEATA